MLQKSTHCHQRTLSWTTGPSVTSPWLGLRWCWLDTSPPTSSPTIFRQVQFSEVGEIRMYNHICRSVCDRVLDLISHPHGRHPGAYGPPGHPVPGAGQHLQQCYHQHSQGWGSDCHWGLDVGLHSLCVWCFSRVSIQMFVDCTIWISFLIFAIRDYIRLETKRWVLLYLIQNLMWVTDTVMLHCRYATLLFKKQRYVSGQHKVNLKIICKENYKYEVQEKSPANHAVTVQQLNEEYWR